MAVVESVSTKPPQKSKTILVNIAAFLVMLINKQFGWAEITVEEGTAVMVALNILLRLVTKGRISLS